MKETGPKPYTRCFLASADKGPISYLMSRSPVSQRQIGRMQDGDHDDGEQLCVEAVRQVDRPSMPEDREADSHDESVEQERPTASDRANRNVPPQFGYWLGTRAKRGFGTQPSTWQNGLDDSRKVL